MDENKLAASRKRRIATRPRLEPLEGRNLMAASASQVGFKEVANGSVVDLIITGTNKADVIGISDNGTGATGNITVSFGGGQTYVSQSVISVIEVQGKGGNDQVTYNLNGNLIADRSVVVDLGAGNDQFTANLTGAEAAPTGLDLEAYGDAGNDQLTINQPGMVQSGSVIPYLDGGAGNDTLTYNGTGTVVPGASLLPGLSGGTGNDTIKSSYTGIIGGNYIYNLTIDGGAGNDNISDDVHVLAGSPGTVGTDSTTPAVVLGGAGNDQIHFAVRVDPGARPVRGQRAGGRRRGQGHRRADLERAERSHEREGYGHHLSHPVSSGRRSLAAPRIPKGSRPKATATTSRSRPFEFRADRTRPSGPFRNASGKCRTPQASELGGQFASWIACHHRPSE